MKNITMIAAIGQNRELGKDNRLLWHLPEDLKFFKEQTMGKPIIMGKRTLDSLPRLLPGRLHLVLTHQEIEPNDQIKVFRSIDSLVEFIATLDQEVMVIGGAQVYKEMLEIIRDNKEVFEEFYKINKHYYNAIHRWAEPQHGMIKRMFPIIPTIKKSK